MSNHTSGPWHRSGYDGGWDCVRGKDRQIIAKLVENTPANADLIAAAPDLLAALKKVKRILESREFRAVEDSASAHGVQYRGKEFTQPDVDDAIRKAEGEIDE